MSSDTTTLLTGDALKARLAELGQADEGSAAIACGYVSKTGKASLAAFRQARLEAHGLALGAPRATGSRKGKPLSFQVTTGSKNGNIVMAGGYSALLGIEPGGQVQIRHQGDALILTAADTTPAAPVVDATPVVTYDTPLATPEPAVAAAVCPF